MIDRNKYSIDKTSYSDNYRKSKSLLDTVASSNIKDSNNAYNTALTSYDGQVKDIQTSRNAYLKRISDNTYLNKIVKFTNGTYAFVTNQGYVKKLETNISNYTNILNRDIVNISFSWNSNWIPGTIISTDPQLVVGTPMTTTSQSIGNEGNNVLYNSFDIPKNISYAGCYDDSASTSYIGSRPSMNYILNGDFSQNNINWYSSNMMTLSATQKLTNWDSNASYYKDIATAGYSGRGPTGKKDLVELVGSQYITQTIDSLPISNYGNATYELSFYYCGSINGSNNNSFAVIFNGVRQATIQPISNNWTLYKKNITVTDVGPKVLSFAGTGTSGKVAIQDVALYAVGDYTYDSCRNTAVYQGKQYFGLQQYNTETETGFCSVSNTVPTNSAMTEDDKPLWKSENQTDKSGTIAQLSVNGILTLYDDKYNDVYASEVSTIPTNYIGCFQKTTSGIIRYEGVKNIKEGFTSIREGMTAREKHLTGGKGSGSTKYGIGGGSTNSNLVNKVPIEVISPEEQAVIDAKTAADTKYEADLKRLTDAKTTADAAVTTSQKSYDLDKGESDKYQAAFNITPTGSARTKLRGLLEAANMLTFNSNRKLLLDKDAAKDAADALTNLNNNKTAADNQYPIDLANAKTNAQNASTNAGETSRQETAAKNAATEAASYETAAKNAATNAQTARNAAKPADAQTAATSAQNSATEAKKSSDAAQTAATNAKNAAAKINITNVNSSAANTSATNAQKYADNAKISSDAAQTAATNAQTTATNAQTDATNAKIAADNANVAAVINFAATANTEATKAKNEARRAQDEATNASNAAAAAKTYISSANVTSANAEATKAQTAADNAKTAAYNAKIFARNAQGRADSCKILALQTASAQSEATKAQGHADDAQTEATKAQTAATNAQTAADDARTAAFDTKQKEISNINDQRGRDEAQKKLWGDYKVLASDAEKTADTAATAAQTAFSAATSAAKVAEQAANNALTADDQTVIAKAVAAAQTASNTATAEATKAKTAAAAAQTAVNNIAANADVYSSANTSYQNAERSATAAKTAADNAVNEVAKAESFVEIARKKISDYEDEQKRIEQKEKDDEEASRKRAEEIKKQIEESNKEISEQAALDSQNTQVEVFPLDPRNKKEICNAFAKENGYEYFLLDDSNQCFGIPEFVPKQNLTARTCTIDDNTPVGGSDSFAIYMQSEISRYNDSNRHFYLEVDDNIVTIFRGRPEAPQGPSTILYTVPNDMSLFPNPDWKSINGKGGKNTLFPNIPLIENEWIGSPNGTLRLQVKNGHLMIVTNRQKCSTYKNSNNRTYSYGNIGSNAIYNLGEGVANNGSKFNTLSYIDADSKLHTYEPGFFNLDITYKDLTNTNIPRKDGTTLTSISTIEQCKTKCDTDTTCFGYSYNGSLQTCNILQEADVQGGNMTSDTNYYSALKNKKPKTTRKNPGISSTVIGVGSNQYFNYNSAGNTPYKPDRVGWDQNDNNSLVNKEADQIIRKKYDANASQVQSQYNKNNVDYRDTNAQQKRNDLIEKGFRTANYNKIVSDSDIVTLQRNSSYLLWSILAVGTVLVSMNIVRK
jgi:hypothetical protein